MLQKPLAIIALLAASPVVACELALVLAVDVSGSVDKGEYDIQLQGLAMGLRDGIVVDALIEQQAQITLIQWTGASRQRQTIPWRRVKSADDVYTLANEIAGNRRVWHSYSTAIGEALIAAEEALSDVMYCKRKVIDVSGDGVSNEGIMPSERHAVLSAMGVTINALAIETDDADLTGWFYENLIHGHGAFVMTANGFDDYPAQIRQKLQRETTRQLSNLR